MKNQNKVILLYMEECYLISNDKFECILDLEELDYGSHSASSFLGFWQFHLN